MPYLIIQRHYFLSYFNFHLKIVNSILLILSLFQKLSRFNFIYRTFLLRILTRKNNKNCEQVERKYYETIRRKKCLLSYNNHVNKDTFDMYNFIVRRIFHLFRNWIYKNILSRKKFCLDIKTCINFSPRSSIIF